MTLRNRIISTRNAIDFALRRRIAIGLPVTSLLNEDIQFQKEMQQFLDLFPWKTAVAHHAKNAPFKVLDIGARNFSLAPVLYRCFAKEDLQAEIHGIEIDAYRRLRNLRTRRDYAGYVVSQVPKSRFHVGDFLDWNVPMDCLFAMNPFVTQSPLLAWGLPLKHFKPEKFFEKVSSLLTPGRGLLFVTNPSHDEREITREYLQDGFRCLEEHNWKSPSGNRPRYGGLYLRK